MKNVENGVKVWEQDIVIPTYRTGVPDKNPMFLEKRVYQGSSGRVYPHSVIDKISDEKTDRTYRGVFLENKYLFVMILPELGGRIQRALDKTNNYDFVYYNHVIKPALVGLAGPWISGGIEFNWPQHHRPSTFDPVNYRLAENGDGSCTVTVSEIENMFRTKGMASFTLYPDRAYIEIRARLYNRTGERQSFLWWANPAVPVNGETQSVFPPDVHAVMDHGKRDVSTFPIATGTYYKMDYSSGVDISRYKNIPVPTSYMACRSDYDFVGGYDHGRQAGILHVADHHISPGKKQWTWGCGDFGKAWDRNLTDSDGPYVELMTGCFTDNQPDFSWMEPYEEKTFTQYFMPYRKIGVVKNATSRAAVNLERTEGGLRAAVYATSEYRGARIAVKAAGKALFEGESDLSPEAVFDRTFPLPEDVREWDCSITVTDREGDRLVSYRPAEPKAERTPDPAKPMPAPADVRTTEELFLCGTHLEQYRHATFEPADYYREGLRRDPTDARLNNAYGSLLMRRGRFGDALPCFEAAIRKLTRLNPNPPDGEPFYNLGLCLRYLGRSDEAYDRFCKAAWNGAWQGAAFYHIACIESGRGDLPEALEHAECSLVRNGHSMKARTLKTALLRRLGRKEEAEAFARESLRIDPMDFAAENELCLLNGKDRKSLFRRMGNTHNTFLEIAAEYAEAGFPEEAAGLLESCAALAGERDVDPMVLYTLGFYRERLGRREEADQCRGLAARAKGDYCFPHRLEEIPILEEAMERDPSDPRAPYYLGNLWYDKKQYGKAAECWERSERLDPDFATVHRNLALACYNKKKDPERALREMETAFRLDPKDARVLMELDQLRKKMGFSPEDRLALLEKHRDVAETRDDLYLETAALLNLTGRYGEAKERIAKRKFHPWEGGEGKVPTQYVLCRVELAKQALSAGDFRSAVSLLGEATEYPENLGEGKLAGAQENNVCYFMGCAYEGLGEAGRARECFEKASRGLTEPAGMMYYNDQPPETIFYQGLALRKLGRETEARSRFYKLVSYGEKHLFDEVRIGYFAVSLPDLQIFDEDLGRKNRVHCLFMAGLGRKGLGEKEKADAALKEALKLDPNHAGVRIHLAFDARGGEKDR